MILHLLKTDWQRLRRPTLGVWIILLLTSLPWLFHNPDGFAVPMSTGGMISGRMRELGLTTDSLLDSGFVQLLVVVSTLLLSTAIGMHDQHWQLASPIRPWKRSVAKALALFLFVVAPQLLLGVGVMLVHGFTLPLILTAAAGTALTLMLLHGTAALFARCCGSFWVWSAAAVCLAALALTKPTAFMSPLFWSNYPGPQVWLLGSTSILALALLPRLFRTRPGSIAAIATAIGSIVIAGFATRKAPPTIWLPSGETDTSTIEVSLSPEGVQLESIESISEGRTSRYHRYTAQVFTSGAPANTYLSWQTGAQALDATNLLYTIRNSTSHQEAQQAILPAPAWRSSIYSGNALTLDKLDSQNPPGSAVLTGVAFRYDILADLPIGENPVSQMRDNFAINARLHRGDQLGPIAEITMCHPKLGISTRCDAVSTIRSSFSQEAIACFLYLPDEEICVELSPALTQSSPLPGGGEWIRLGLATSNALRWNQQSLSGARLIVLQPVLLDVIQRELQIPPDIHPGTPESTDWMLAYRYGLSNAAYLKLHRPFRPDPASCSAGEFARYLRTVSASFPGETNERDLAEYASRFPDLLAMYAQRQSVVEVIASAVPESAKDEILATIDGPQQAYQLASALDERGWQADARDSLLACLDPPFMAHHSGQIYQVVAAIAELEDPETYPSLLAAFEQTRHSHLYDIIRNLPGIEAQLDQVIERVSESLPASPAFPQASTNAAIDMLETFTPPVSHGNPTAFAKLLSFLQGYATDQNIYVPGEVKELIESNTDNPRAFREFIIGKTASDFDFNPLTRRWQPTTTAP